EPHSGSDQMRSGLVAEILDFGKPLDLDHRSTAIKEPPADPDAPTGEILQAPLLPLEFTEHVSREPDGEILPPVFIEVQVAEIAHLGSRQHAALDHGKASDSFLGEISGKHPMQWI